MVGFDPILVHEWLARAIQCPDNTAGTCHARQAAVVSEALAEKALGIRTIRVEPKVGTLRPSAQSDHPGTLASVFASGPEADP